MKKIYIIKTISEHHIYYAVSTDKDLSNRDNLADLENYLPHSGIAELKQEWIGETIMDCSDPLTEAEYVKSFDTFFPGNETNKDEKLMAIVEVNDLDCIILNESERYMKFLSEQLDLLSPIIEKYFAEPNDFRTRDMLIRDLKKAIPGAIIEDSTTSQDIHDYSGVCLKFSNTDFNGIYLITFERKKLEGHNGS